MSAIGLDNIPHLSLPLRYAAGAYLVNQQDTDAEAADCVVAIVSFQRDSRIELPEFGIRNPSFFNQPIDVEDIAQTINDWEPRVDAEIYTLDHPDGMTEVKIKVTLPLSDEMPEER